MGLWVRPALTNGSLYHWAFGSASCSAACSAGAPFALAGSAAGTPAEESGVNSSLLAVEEFPRYLVLLATLLLKLCSFGEAPEASCKPAKHVLPRYPWGGLTSTTDISREPPLIQHIADEDMTSMGLLLIYACKDPVQCLILQERRHTDRDRMEPVHRGTRQDAEIITELAHLLLGGCKYAGDS